MDTEKRELVGDFKNRGKTWRKKGEAKEVTTYDFLSLAIGVGISYGAYDSYRNEGIVNGGISHDTSEFTVESIRQWWHIVGKKVLSGRQRVVDLRRWWRKQWK